MAKQVDIKTAETHQDRIFKQDVHRLCEEMINNVLQQQTPAAAVVIVVVISNCSSSTSIRI